MEVGVLLFVGLAWLVFAVVQDLRTREISNWLTFSLLAISLLYHAGYALFHNDISFFLFAVGGVALFVAIAYLLYYARAFAGGDAKLLMAIGGVLPFASFRDYLFVGLGFVLMLFAVGAVYSLVYTIFCVVPRWRVFSRHFASEIKKLQLFCLGAFVAGIIAGLLAGQVDVLYGALFFFVIACLPFVYVYARSVEKVCFVKFMKPALLTEGDWLVEDVKVRGKFIRANVHGLSMNEIALLRRAKKSVWIKQGVPFAPAFLISFVIMVFYVLA
jgi:Flp pilus assembly protein protease CpaA